MEYTFPKKINETTLDNSIRANSTIGSRLVTLYMSGASTVTVRMDGELSSEELTVLEDLVNSSVVVNPTVQVIYQNVVRDAITFGNQVIFEFAVENVLLGITGLGLTSKVRKVTSEITSALMTGSLYDAVFEITKLQGEDLDDVILTPTRILAFRHKLETKLGKPLSSHYQDPVNY